jgi:hypothetical protein
VSFGIKSAPSVRSGARGARRKSRLATPTT